MRLAEFISIKKGKKPSLISDTPIADGVRFIQIEDLRSNNELKFCKSDRSQVVVSSNNVLIAWDGANAGTVGFGLEGAIGSTIASLEFDSTKVYPPYLGFFLRSNFDFLRSNATGATIPHLTRDSLLSLDLPVRQYDEQISISKKLSKLVEVKEQRITTIELLDNYLRSLFIEMFGDPRTNPKKWQIVSPADVASSDRNSIAIGPFGSNLLTSDYRASGVPLIFVKNIRELWFSGSGMKYVTPEKAKELVAHQVKGRDVLMTKMGEPPGDPAVYPDGLPDGVITADCIKLRVNEAKANPYFVCSMFDSDYIRSTVAAAARGVAQQKINLSLFKELKFPLPPKGLQDEYVAKLEEVKRLKENLIQNREELNTLFSSLLFESFQEAKNV